MKQSGWMVNFAMRRVEPVTVKDSRLSRLTYHCYQGPKRTYMLHDEQVFDTELEATMNLHDRMTARFNGLEAQVKKYKSELTLVKYKMKNLCREALQ